MGGDSVRDPDPSPGGQSARFAILGPLVVAHGGLEITVPPVKPRTLLALLLLRANEIASAGWLAETLWDSRPPATARTALQNHVMRLRRALGGGLGARIRTRSTGYLLEVRPGELDLHRFTGLRDRGRAATRRGDWDEAAYLLRDALAQWAGEPLADIRIPASLAAEVQWLAESRLQALEWRIDADLRLGRHADIVTELRHLAAAHPLRERFREQLMLALYRDGRQAEALAAYQEARGTLVKELGVEPGTSIQRLHERILSADPGLADGGGPGPGPARRADLPPPVCQLPADVPDFAGRAGECARLRQLLTQPETETAVPVAVISGPPGAGKSTLALHVAHSARACFPDGQLYVQLTDLSSRPRKPREVLGELLRALGAAAIAIPEATGERAALYRSLLADRKVLVVADDAQSARQVSALLPGTTGCAVIVTSRSRLTTLPGAKLFPVDCLTTADASEMLGRIIGRRRVVAEPAAAGRLLTACGRLPLAIRIAGARLAARPAWPIATLADMIADERHRLDELSAADLEVRASVALSYRSLDGRAKRAFRLLGLLGPHDVAEWVIAALLGESSAADVVDVLADKSLLTPVGVDATGQPRYRLHDLLRHYAVERLAVDPGREPALVRVLTGFLELADLADAKLPCESFFPPPPRLAARTILAEERAAQLTADPMAWFSSERLNLLTVTAAACASGRHELASQLAVRQATFQYREGRFDDGEYLWRIIAAAAAGAAQPRAAASAEFWLSAVIADHGRHADAMQTLDRCAAAFERLGDIHSLALCRYLRGVCAHSLELHTLCCTETRRGLALARQLRDRRAECLNLRVLGLGLSGLGRHDAAIRRCGQALAIARELLERDQETQALYSLARVNVAAGQYGVAVGLCREGLELCQQMPGTAGEPYYLRLLGTAYRRTSRFGDAADALSRALQIFEDRGEPHGQALCLLEIGELRRAVGEPEQAIGYLDRGLLICRELSMSSSEARARRAIEECRQLARTAR